MWNPLLIVYRRFQYMHKPGEDFVFLKKIFWRLRKCILTLCSQCNHSPTYIIIIHTYPTVGDFDVYVIGIFLQGLLR